MVADRYRVAERAGDRSSSTCTRPGRHPRRRARLHALSHRYVSADAPSRAVLSADACGAPCSLRRGTGVGVVTALLEPAGLQEPRDSVAHLLERDERSSPVIEKVGILGLDLPTPVAGEDVGDPRAAEPAGVEAHKSNDRVIQLGISEGAGFAFRVRMRGCDPAASQVGPLTETVFGTRPRTGRAPRPQGRRA